MPTSSDLITHLSKRITTVCPFWKMTAVGGQQVAYCQHTRPLVIDGTTYNVAPVEISTVSQSIGLKPNTVQLTGYLDETITRKTVEDGVWKSASIYFGYVNYRDVTMGVTGVQKGKAGKFELVSNF